MSSTALNLRQTESMTAGLLAGRKEIVIAVAVAVAVMVPALVFGIPSNRDLSNHFRFALPFYDALESGNVFPSWLPDSNGGYGDASFRFYPPALYYLLALMRFLTRSWYAATLATFTLINALGAMGVYLWAKTILPSREAMWASIFFSLMPYHLNQYYQATMLAEFAATSVLPFSFYFVEKVCESRRTRNVAGLALFYALLLLTHLPLAVIGSLALGIYALLRLPKTARLKTSVALATGIFLGLLASARFWTTVIAEQPWIRADNILPDPSVDYRVNFIFSTLSPENLNVWWMNILLAATFAMLWPSITLLWSFKSKPELVPTSRIALIAPIGLLALTLFMSTPVSRFIWNLVRPLQQTQFPWRWLAIMSMVVPIVMAATLPYWESIAKGKKRSLAILAAGSIVISIAFSAAHTVREAKNFDASQFARTLQEIPGSRGVSQWWPSWVHEPFQEMKTAVASQGREVAIERWDPERREFIVGAGKSDVRVRTFFYPHWKAFSGSSELSVRPDTDGAILVSVPEHASSVVLQFQEPGRVRMTTFLSLLGFLLIFGLMFFRQPLFYRDRAVTQT